VYEYRVEPVHLESVGFQTLRERIEQVLNRAAAEGWRLRCMQGTPGGIEPLLLVLERTRPESPSTGTVTPDG
jgi:hypothetical protein